MRTLRCTLRQTAGFAVCISLLCLSWSVRAQPASVTYLTAFSNVSWTTAFRADGLSVDSFAIAANGTNSAILVLNKANANATQVIAVSQTDGVFTQAPVSLFYAPFYNVSIAYDDYSSALLLVYWRLTTIPNQPLKVWQYCYTFGTVAGEDTTRFNDCFWSSTQTLTNVQVALLVNGTVASFALILESQYATTLRIHFLNYDLLDQISGPAYYEQQTSPVVPDSLAVHSNGQSFLISYAIYVDPAFPTLPRNAFFLELPFSLSSWGAIGTGSWVSLDYRMQSGACQFYSGLGVGFAPRSTALVSFVCSDNWTLYGVTLYLPDNTGERDAGVYLFLANSTHIKTTMVVSATDKITILRNVEDELLRFYYLHGAWQMGTLMLDIGSNVVTGLSSMGDYMLGWNRINTSQIGVYSMCMGNANYGIYSKSTSVVSDVRVSVSSYCNRMQGSYLAARDGDDIVLAFPPAPPASVRSSEGRRSAVDRVLAVLLVLGFLDWLGGPLV